MSNLNHVSTSHTHVKLVCVGLRPQPAFINKSEAVLTGIDIVMAAEIIEAVDVMLEPGSIAMSI
jgi:hypothetical protein